MKAKHMHRLIVYLAVECSTLLWSGFLLPALAQDSICDGNTPRSDNEANAREFYTIGYEESSPSPTHHLSNGTSLEWTFLPHDPKDFLTLSLDKFDLEGPECEEGWKNYSSVTVETYVDSKLVSYIFCKGRAPPYTVFSSTAKMRVVYCNKYPQGSISFTISSGCTAEMLVAQEKKSVTIKKNKAVCWLYLRSLSKKGIRLKLSDVKTKRVSTSRCIGAFISVQVSDKTGKMKSILDDGEERMCDVKTQPQQNTDFQYDITSDGVNITYKHADFKAEFWEPSDDEPPVVTSSTTDRSSNSGNDSATQQDADFTDDTGGQNNKAHIIALACGGCLVVIVVIVTICIVKRRRPRIASRVESKKKKPKREPSVKYSQDDTNEFDDDSGVQRTPSIGSINNAMYGQVLDATPRNDNKRDGNNDRKSSQPAIARHTSTTNDSRRRRLAELEEKYGPFPDIPETSPGAFALPPLPMRSDQHGGAEIQPLCKSSTSVDEQRLHLPIGNSYEMTRKGTRPFLPPPPGIAAAFGTNDARLQPQIGTNFYESIDDANARIKPMTSCEARPSYDPVAPDDSLKFGQRQLPSYDAVAPEDAIPDTNSFRQVSYDSVANDDHFSETRLATQDHGSFGGSMPNRRARHVVRGASETPVIDIQPPEYTEPNAINPIPTASSTPLLSEGGHPGDGRARKFPNPYPRRNMSHANSSGAISSFLGPRGSTDSHLSPHPSLPEVPRGQYVTIDSGRSCSVTSSLQEDVDNYLQPRPSHPDAFLPCAYSSSEDITDMRRRLIKAAHPCLIDNPNELRIRNETATTESPPQRKNLYDSPRPSLGDIGLNTPLVAKQSGPRRPK